MSTILQTYRPQKYKTIC